MRYVALLIVLIFSSNSQAQNCRGPINPRTFQSILNQIQGVRQSEARFRMATQQTGSYCLSSTQVYQVCALLGQDPYRIDFAYNNYPRVLDPQNFYDVYDAFEFFSSAFRLHDLVIGSMAIEMVPIPDPIPEPEPIPVPVPEPLCEVSGSEVAEIKGLIDDASFKDAMERQAKMMIRSKQCLRVDQIIDILSVFDFDDSKLEVAKYAFDYCMDTQNYYRVLNAFTFMPQKDSMQKFIEERL